MFRPLFQLVSPSAARLSTPACRLPLRLTACQTGGHLTSSAPFKLTCLCAEASKFILPRKPTRLCQRQTSVMEFTFSTKALMFCHFCGPHRFGQSLKNPEIIDQSLYIYIGVEINKVNTNPQKKTPRVCVRCSQYIFTLLYRIVC